jgi:hypothetical protein
LIQIHRATEELDRLFPGAIFGLSRQTDGTVLPQWRSDVDEDTKEGVLAFLANFDWTEPNKSAFSDSIMKGVVAGTLPLEAVHLCFVASFDIGALPGYWMQILARRPIWLFDAHIKAVEDAAKQAHITLKKENDHGISK